MKAGAMERRRQPIAIELRIVPGRRKPSHVDDPPYSVGFEKTDERLNGSSRMADREDHDSRRPASYSQRNTLADSAVHPSHTRASTATSPA